MWYFFIFISDLRQLATIHSTSTDRTQPRSERHAPVTSFMAASGTGFRKINPIFGLVHQRRAIHSCSVQRHADKTGTIDEFRANEQKIEREYEEKSRKEEDEKRSESVNETTEDHEKIKQIREQILDASLQFVSKHGWTREAIAQGANSINYPSVAHGMFPNGGIELIHYFYAKCNRELIDKLQQEMKNTSKDEKIVAGDGTQIASNPKEFAAKAIQLRLEMIAPYIDTWPQALGIMSLPQNVPTSLAQLLTLVDDICYCAGDRSVDVSSSKFFAIFSPVFKSIKCRFFFG